jgi:hypothetical protein
MAALNGQGVTNLIPTFAPGQILRFSLSQGFNLDKKKDDVVLTPMQFDVSAEYEAAGQEFSDVYHVDMSPFLNTHTPRTTPEILEQIEKRLEKIASTR